MKRKAGKKPKKQYRLSMRTMFIIVFSLNFAAASFLTIFTWNYGDIRRRQADQVLYADLQTALENAKEAKKKNEEAYLSAGGKDDGKTQAEREDKANSYIASLVEKDPSLIGTDYEQETQNQGDGTAETTAVAGGENNAQNTQQNSGETGGEPSYNNDVDKAPAVIYTPGANNSDKKPVKTNTGSNTGGAAKPVAQPSTPAAPKPNKPAGNAGDEEESPPKNYPAVKTPADYGITVSYGDGSDKIDPSPLKYANSKRLNEMEYYRFGLLNDTQKMVYMEIKKAVYLTQNRVRFEGASFTHDDLVASFQAFTMDHPECFWLDCNTMRSSTGFDMVSLILCYTDGTNMERDGNPASRSLINQQIREVASKLKTMVAKANGASTKAAKERALFDALLQNTRYDYDHFNGKKVRYYANNIYGGLYQGLSVCGGYASTMQILCYEVGINCLKVLGSGHVWNMVNLGRNWYHADATWADTSTPNYFYFNATTAEIQTKQSIAASNPRLPSANVAFSK